MSEHTMSHRRRIDAVQAPGRPKTCLPGRAACAVLFALLLAVGLVGGSSEATAANGPLSLNAPIVGVTSTPDGGGYWLVGSDGGVFTFGDARFHGSAANQRLAGPIVG